MIGLLQLRARFNCKAEDAEDVLNRKRISCFIEDSGRIDRKPSLQQHNSKPREPAKAGVTGCLSGRYASRFLPTWPGGRDSRNRPDERITRAVDGAPVPHCRIRTGRRRRSLPV